MTAGLFDLSGKVAIVTGGNGGIGLGMARGLAQAGAAIAVVGRNQTKSKDAVAELTESGARAVAIAADVTDKTAVDGMIARVLTELGRIDILINNAGIFEEAPLDQPGDHWLAAWERTMRINLTASAELCRLAVLHWQAREAAGRIVNVASRAAYRGDSPAHWHYAASKAGMVAMTKTIARGYARSDILAFAVCPGFTMTGMAEDYLSSRGGDTLLADIPLGRVAEPEEVAATVRFLALEAPASMTGAVIDINGASYVR
jgi:NAD(P)-dependent dehydrogenase (short-subunit alcohol dehydrogenase family)